MRSSAAGLYAGIDRYVMICTSTSPTMKKSEAKQKIDDFHRYYEEGAISAAFRDELIECTALIYRLRRNNSRYRLLDK
jgi:hypothetical protein